MVGRQADGTAARRVPGHHRPRLTAKASAQAHRSRRAEARRAISWSEGCAALPAWSIGARRRRLTPCAPSREAMIETVRHRGPDAGEVWVEAEGGVALGQRRLAIIDLSPGGAQPMHSADRRYVITFNGEIYNYRDIRGELQAAGRSMRSDSDTEVLLEACALWGVEAAIERAIGMFAFALWDRKTRTPDPGARPPRHQAALLRGHAGAGSVRLAAQGVSRRRPIGSRRSMTDAVVGYLRHAYIAQPRTIYREAQKLAPGHILTLREGSMPSPKCFWDLRGIAIAGQRAQRSRARRAGGDRATRRACCAIPSSCG